MATPSTVQAGTLGGYALGVIDAAINLTPETGAGDSYCGADLPPSLEGIGVTQKFESSGQPYPTNCWLSQVLRPPASQAQGAFYPLPFGILPNPVPGNPGCTTLNVSAAPPLLSADFAPGPPDGTVSPFDFAWVGGATSANWTSSIAIFNWLAQNPSGNPYLKQNGTLLRKDLSSLATDLAGSPYTANAQDIQDVLTNYATEPPGNLIDYLVQPEVQLAFQPNGNDWTIAPAQLESAAATFQRLLIDRYDALSADLQLPWGNLQGTMKVVRGSPFLSFLLPDYDLDLLVRSASGVPQLTLASGDNGDANGFPTTNSFGMTLNGNFWGLFQTPESTFQFLDVKDGPLASLPGAFVIRTGTQAGTSTASQRCFVLAMLPWDDDMATRQATLQTFAGYVFNFVQSGSVTFAISPTDNSVTTTFTLDTANVLDQTGGPQTTVLGLLPHHRNENALVSVGGAAPGAPLYASQIGPRGVVTFFPGDSFQTKHTFPGILPSFPSPFTSTTASANASLTAYLKNFADLYGSSTQRMPWYPGTWDAVTDTSRPYYPFAPNDTYGAGKQMGNLMQYAAAAEAAAAAGVTAAAAQAASATAALKSLMALWLGDPGAASRTLPAGVLPPNTQPPPQPYPFYYFAWYEPYHTMLGYPGGYGSTTALNDHHFHYGYFIHAAAWLAVRDPDFVANYGPMIDLLVADVACTPDIQTYVSGQPFGANLTFPELRYFDAFEGHPWATGYQPPSVDGPQNEAATEALNSWIGMVLWGRIAGRPAIEQAGIYLVATHTASINEYCFNVGADLTVDSTAGTVVANADADGNVGNVPGALVNFSGKVYDTATGLKVQASNLGWLVNTRLFASGVSTGTDWQEFPTYRYTILWLPVTAGALFLGRYTNYNQAAFLQMQNAAAAEVNALTVPAYTQAKKSWKITPGRYWQALLNHPYTWATVTLPYAALSAGTGTFYFPGSGSGSGGEQAPASVFESWVAAAAVQAATRYPPPQGQQAPPVNYQAAGVYFQEDGSTVAGAYHAVVALGTFGRPVFGGTATDTGAKAALPLAAFFLDDAGKTLNMFAYNAGRAAITVQFADGAGTPLGATLSIPPGTMGQQTAAYTASLSFLPATHTAMALPKARTGPVPAAGSFTATGLMEADGKTPWSADFPTAGSSFPAGSSRMPYVAGSGFLPKVVAVSLDGAPGNANVFGLDLTASSATLLAIDTVPAASAGAHDLWIQQNGVTSKLKGAITYSASGTPTFTATGLVQADGKTPWSTHFPAEGKNYPATPSSALPCVAGTGFSGNPLPTVSIDGPAGAGNVLGLSPGSCTSTRLAIDSIPATAAGTHDLWITQNGTTVKLVGGITFSSSS